MFHLVAYDIADPRRLHKVARFLERRALRCQKSVFLFDGTESALAKLLDGIAALIDPSADCVQAWRLFPGQPALGHLRGISAVVRPAGVVVYQSQSLFLKDPNR